MRRFFVYILCNDRRTVFYTGITNDIACRIMEHRSGQFRNSFTYRYNVYRLVYVEEHASAYEAIVAEKRVKDWRRSKKVKLIESLNPSWHDLTSRLY
ncbi:MAG: GIY-YIG nuclease family protein [Candidatus Kerfeldbacteria bacterium]|nr:GIY-YIG nuclease family protein [Candidatus Kerfeldbacteria bacterium]